MNKLGSVFLGDRVQHIPQHLVNMPLSPPPTDKEHSQTLHPPEPSLDGQTDEGDEGVDKEDETVQIAAQLKEEAEPTGPEDPPAPDPPPADGPAPNLDALLSSGPVSMSPELMLELRLKWLETLVLGIGKDGNVVSPKEQDATGTLVRKVNDAQRVLDDTVKMNDGLKRFMAVYNQNAHLLTPAFAHGLVPTTEGVSVSDLEALLLESEADIRAADRDLREIAELESRGVLDAGKLPIHEPLQPRLDALTQAHLEDMSKFDALEERIAKLIARYSSHVNGLSELFVAWDAALNQADVVITRLEKERQKAKETSFD
ncbi:hypothetical protein RhiJN_14823 [Ceratobasidium sp. AG-Ba]|nr:hypothetical protein RhiJN_14823 [Ceratobasidium sp. AG-Ba]QRW15359.1 hypothetical protein RhiLY_14358 [Ceratobasidium sp. AG-Ba]